MTSTQKRRAKPQAAEPAPLPPMPHAPVQSASIAENATVTMEVPKPRMGVRVVECEVEQRHSVFATEQERKVLARQRARAPEVALPRITLEWDGKEPCFVPQHIDKAIGWQLLMDAFGSTSRTFVEGLLAQLLYLTDKGESEQQLNFLVSLVQSLKPRVEAEAVLAVQIAATHLWTMKWAGRMNYTSNAIQDEMLIGMYAKLARTSAAQFDALKRYRTGGEQKITVQHVQNVSVDGQAIVGNVTHMRGKTAAEPSPSAAETPAAPAPALTYTPQPTMPIIDEPAGAPAPARARRRRK